MKQYRILCDHVTAKTGAKLSQNQVHPEEAFYPGHAAQLVEQKLIEEVTDEELKAAPAEGPKKPAKK